MNRSLVAAGPSSEMIEDARELLAEASTLYADDDDVSSTLRRLRARLDEPLRVALAGRIKAGKSTLLNAIVGEQLAPTDTGECTRVVTWYRHGEVPAVTVRLRDGRAQRLPVRRIEGRLQLATGGHAPDEVARIEVSWPSPALTAMTLVDTPGLASLSTEVSERAAAALTPAEGVPEVDAVMYLMRHLHSSDAELMEAFREATVGGASPVGTIAVLSRADEIGSGRIDAMVSAVDVATRYSADPRVRAVAMDVLPVAGLLAEGARTLRQVDFDALREVALLDPAEREGLMLSADRFAGAELEQLRVATPALRADLLSRIGPFGVRLATALLRGPVPDATTLAQELTRRSGLVGLTTALDSQLRHRAELLKTRSALAGLALVLSANPREDIAELVDRTHWLRGADHGLVELEWLTRLRRGDAAYLDEEQRRDAERLLGGNGDGPAGRLGLDDDQAHDARQVAQQSLGRWRAVVTDPLNDPETVAVARVVVRSLDGLLTRLDGP